MNHVVRNWICYIRCDFIDLCLVITYSPIRHPIIADYFSSYLSNKKKRVVYEF